MAPRWTNSADKHRIPRADQIFALVNATYVERLPGESLDEGEVWLYLGHPHAHTDREIELLVTLYDDGRDAVVFHAMELGPKFRRRREEHGNV